MKSKAKSGTKGNILHDNRGVHVVISSILIFSIVIFMVFAVYIWGIPQVETSKDVATMEAMKTNLVSLDHDVLNAGHEGEGSIRINNIKITKGRLTINDSQDTMTFEMESRAKVIEPNYSITDGPIKIKGAKSPRGYFNTSFILNYSSRGIDLVGDDSIGKGIYNIKFTNNGYNTSSGKVMVQAVIQ